MLRPPEKPLAAVSKTSGGVQKPLAAVSKTSGAAKRRPRGPPGSSSAESPAATASLARLAPLASPKTSGGFKKVLSVTPRNKNTILPLLRNFVTNRPRMDVDGIHSEVPLGAIRLCKIGIVFVNASVCSERTRSVYFIARGAFFARANTKNERNPGSRFWANF